MCSSRQLHPLPEDGNCFPFPTITSMMYMQLHCNVEQTANLAPAHAQMEQKSHECYFGIPIPARDVDHRSCASYNPNHNLAELSALMLMG